MKEWFEEMTDEELAEMAEQALGEMEYYYGSEREPQ